MQSRLLSSFLVVAQKGSITEAANVLNISQPALTKSMRRLEDELGVQLFERFSTGVRLTRYGEILLRHAKIMENEYRHAVTRIGELRDGRKANLRIGAGPVWLVSILPPLIAQFQKKHPDIHISLVGGVIDTLLPDLIAGDVDLICVSLDFPNRPDVIKEKLFETNHILISDPAHPLVDKKAVSAEEVHKYPWMVLKSDYIGNERISSFFAANGLSPPEITFETTSINSLFYALKSGMHIAHVPEQMLETMSHFGLKEIDLADTIWETSAGYAYRKSARVATTIRKFIDELHTLTMDQNSAKSG